MAAVRKLDWLEAELDSTTEIHNDPRLSRSDRAILARSDPIEPDEAPIDAHGLLLMRGVPD